MKIGLFFGSFNPFHLGHKIIASYFVEFTDLERVMFVVSPQNPFKEKASLLNQNHRLMIIRMEIEDNNKLQVSDIEFHMPQPSYTVDTLTYLCEKNPEHDYSLIMGSDNLKTFHKWKNYESILENYNIYVYPRPSYSVGLRHKHIHVIKGAPYMEISASFIRRSIKERRNVSYLIPEKAWKYIDDMNFYK